MFHFRAASKCRQFLQKCYYSNLTGHVLEHLKERSLIRVSGPDVTDFLQGLITNDIHHLNNGNGNMFTFFLNIKGRVIFDSIIYHVNQPNTYFIECDASVVDKLQRHLKIYLIRRKVNVSSLENEFSVYSVFNPTFANSSKEKSNANRLEGLIVPCDMLNGSSPDGTKFCKTFQDLFIYRDPRISDLGLRVICPKDCDVQKQVSNLINIDNNSKLTYRWFRYRLGVGEGVNDLPFGNCLPLEANCDYLHGISFHKGCYIGQELTARTHHTGVVRKRLMPLVFSKTPTNLPSEESIEQDGVKLGKFRGVEGDAGLALLRITEALNAKEIKIGDGIARTEKPSWWPLEAPKEIASLRKN